MTKINGNGSLFWMAVICEGDEQLLLYSISCYKHLYFTLRKNIQDLTRDLAKVEGDYIINTRRISSVGPCLFFSSSRAFPEQTVSSITVPSIQVVDRWIQGRKCLCVCVCVCVGARGGGSPWKQSRYSSFCMLLATCMMAMGKQWEEAENMAPASEVSFLSRNSVDRNNSSYRVTSRLCLCLMDARSHQAIYKGLVHTNNSALLLSSFNAKHVLIYYCIILNMFYTMYLCIM